MVMRVVELVSWRVGDASGVVVVGDTSGVVAVMCLACWWVHAWLVGDVAIHEVG